MLGFGSGLELWSPTVNPKVSVVVCTHSPRKDFLGRALEGLRTQTLDKSRWELVLIDNASKGPLATWLDLSWHPQARIIEEPVLGQMPARLRGIAESVGELIVFVDDDNVLAADYLDRALVIGEQWPQLGVWGGQQLPEYEVQPPPELGPYLCHLATRSLDRDLWAMLPGRHEALPWGAGMCFRRIVGSQWHTAVQKSPMRMRLGRTGNSLASGVGDEDSDLAMTAFDVGLGTGLFHSLILTHLIPAQRLTEQHLVRLIEAQEYSSMMLLAVRGNQPAFRKPSLLGRIRRWYRYMRTRDRLTARFAAARDRGRDRALDVLHGQPA
jgi:hypothetical protein